MVDRTVLESMPAFLGGGSMISTVTTAGYTLGELPAKFEAGTPPIAEAIGLGAAIEYLNKIGLEPICEHELELTKLAHERLLEIDGLRILGPPVEKKAGIVSFIVEVCHRKTSRSCWIDRASRFEQAIIARCRCMTTWGFATVVEPVFISTTPARKWIGLPKHSPASWPNCDKLPEMWHGSPRRERTYTSRRSVPQRPSSFLPMQQKNRNAKANREAKKEQAQQHH